MNRSQKDLFEQISKNYETKYLQKNTLGEVGAHIDDDWHFSLHNMYGSKNSCSKGNADYNISCQSMSSDTESHVNIHFYKIHGLIDQAPIRWLKVHGYDTINVNCKGIPRCFEWKATFVGSPPDFVTGEGCNLTKKTFAENPITHESHPQ